MQATPRRLWALVLAGGDGTRLQPLTRLIAGRPIPKQYCRIFGSRSLLETTLARVAPLAGRERTLVIVNEGHLPLARPQLRTVLPANVVVQPRNLDTGPGILVSLLALARRDRHAIVAVFPSDHDIRSEAAFQHHVTAMTELVETRPDRVVLLGTRERADTGYGYIAPGPRLDGFGAAFRVLAFHEKPARAVAARIIGRGGLWNSFVMVARVDRLLALLGALRPEDLAALAPVPADPEAHRPTTVCRLGTSRAISSPASPSTSSSCAPTISGGATSEPPRRSSVDSHAPVSCRPGARPGSRRRREDPS